MRRSRLLTRPPVGAVRRSRLLAVATVGAGLAVWPAAGAPAQDPAPGGEPAPPGGQPAPPGPPPPPDLVLSGRNVRMTRGGIVGIRMGCRANATAGEACIGSLTVRLANAIVITVDPPGDKPSQKPRPRRIAPFDFGVRDFTLAIGDATQLRLRLNPRAQALIRERERVRADLIASYSSRQGGQGTAQRNVRIYFPKRPGS